MNGLMPDRMNKLGNSLTTRLERLGEAMPDVNPKRQMTPEEYLPKAIARAERDPAFKEQLQAALTKYRQLGGV